MRRPTPLPPPADASDEVVAERVPPPEVDAETVVAGADIEVAGSDASGLEPEPQIAQVIPLIFTESSAMQRPAEVPWAEPTAEELPADQDAPVRLREVWAASRARRKALRAEVRRFTGRQRRRRAVWIGAAASLVLLVLATLGAAYSPLFGVEQIRIVGADQLDTLAVEAALADQVGTPLPLVDESAVKAALVAFPLVESYSLEARPPHELVVRIVERTPIGLVQTRAGYTLVDAAGVALSTSESPTAGYPVVSVDGGTGSRAFEAVGQVMRSLPDSILVQVTAVSATTPDDVTLTLGAANAQVVWGSAEDSALKAVVLETTMVARPPASVLVYDVSSPHAIVVR
ncbi:MAG TPA: FtsQ-type POTRA domain-containing protein [Microbacterium sp.]|nr:FtsQ-type POTRA domain-containing protein [Microbacterium sp.]